MEWITIDTCPICGSKLSTYYGQGRAPVITFPDVLGGVPLAILTNYVQCVECGLVRQSPRLDDASMAGLYSSGEYRKLLNNTPENIDTDEMLRQKRIFPLIEGKGSHLDIGCSRGYLLEMSQADGRKVFGVEPNVGYTKEGIRTVPTLDLVRGKWDTITCLHVLEHVTDPLQYAHTIMALLAPGGRLILEVPGEQSKGGPLRLWHLYLFTPPIILRLFHDLKLVKYDKTPHHLFVFEK